MAEFYIDGKPVPFPKESPNQRADTDGEKPQYIILHSTGGKFAGAVSWMLQKVSGVSAHFCIARDGQARQLVSAGRVAYHAGISHWGRRSYLNGCSLGVEMEHRDGKEDWPGQQLITVAKLCAVLCRKYNIPTDNILGHNQIAPGRKVDPAGFPWTKFRIYLTQELSRLAR
jgi:N-acetylmuramoyl-L-alanine amidase